ncbi:MAG TPA: SAF domain-containing protein [Thermoanaerobaculia bacterium]|nr:SAF domain-containing protein [Thermoanaerobaculia bacterium]
MVTTDLSDLKKERLVSIRILLGNEDINSSDDLWRAIGPEFYDGLSNLALTTGITPEEVLDILGACAKERVPSFTKREGLIAFTGLLLVTALLCRVFAIFVLTRFEPQMEVVTAKVSLPAYHLVRQEDLALKLKPRRVENVLDQQKVIGRYLLKSVALGQVIQNDQLGPASIPKLLPGKQRVILSVRLAPGTFNSGVIPGSKVTLILSTRNLQGVRLPAVEADAFVLAVDQQNENVQLTVAMDAVKQKEVGAALGNSDVFLAR